MMHSVDIIDAHALSDADREAWLNMRAEQPRLYSPYFHPDYTLALGRLCKDARIAISRDTHGAPVAFFPYQGPRPGRNGFARPIGAPMTDYHGIIHGRSVTPDYKALFSAAGIGALHYAAWVDLSGHMTETFESESTTTLMEFSGGVEQWRESRDSSYRRHLKNNRRRVRKTETDYGPRRFVFNAQDPDLFDLLIAQKKEKFASTGKYDVLSAGWTLELLRSLWKSDGPLRCDLHALYIGDRPAAMDLGLTDGKTFHSWMVGYDNTFHQVAPGIQLLETLIDESERLGYTRIDLGAGLEGYKRHYCTTGYTIGSGHVSVQGPAGWLSDAYAATERFGQKKLGDLPGKLRRRYSQIAACDDSVTGRVKAMSEALRNYRSPSGKAS